MRTGIMIDFETGDMIVKDGSLQIRQTDEQNIQLNIIANKGEMKAHPLLGCEIIKETKGIMSERFLRKMALSLEMDGYSMKDVEMIINN